MIKGGPLIKVWYVRFEGALSRKWHYFPHFDGWRSLRAFFACCLRALSGTRWPCRKSREGFLAISAPPVEWILVGVRQRGSPHHFLGEQKVAVGLWCWVVQMREQRIDRDAAIYGLRAGLLL